MFDSSTQNLQRSHLLYKPVGQWGYRIILSCILRSVPRCCRCAVCQMVIFYKEIVILVSLWEKIIIPGRWCSVGEQQFVFVCSQVWLMRFNTNAALLLSSQGTAPVSVLQDQDCTTTAYILPSSYKSVGVSLMGEHRQQTLNRGN